MNRRAGKKRWLLPEVVQTSALDCGPAALASLLQGFRIDADYERLREQCHTDVDGTSIDALEEVANARGLAAQQRLLPVDHLLAHSGRDNFPCIAVTRLANGFVHFVVAWRRFGPWLQIMDPARGRIWVSRKSFAAMLYQHQMVVSAEDWLAWAQSGDFLAPLREQIGTLGVRPERRRELVADMTKTNDWRRLAAFDAVVRLANQLARAGAWPRRGAAERLTRLHQEALQDPGLLPASVHSVRAHPVKRDQILLTGAIVLSAPRRSGKADADAADVRAASPRWPRLKRALGYLLDTDRGAPGLLAAAACVAGAITILELLAIRFLLSPLTVAQDHLLLLEIVLGVSAFLILGVVLEARSVDTQLGVGRRLEVLTRLRLLERLPRICGRYFASRLSADLTERAHGAHRMRQLPGLFRSLAMSLAQLVCVTAALLWLFPAGWAAIIALALTASLLPFAFQTLLLEKNLKVRTHAGALARYYLASLLGAGAVRAHGAEASIRREHETLLTEWGRAGFGYLRLGVGAEALQALLTGVLAVTLIAGYARGYTAQGGLILVSYWTLRLPMIGYGLSRVLLAWPSSWNAARRVLEPLAAPAAAEPDPDTQVFANSEAIKLELDGVKVCSGGHVLLDVPALTIDAGERVAIVGTSGAGKSTLVRALLGLVDLAAGEIRCNGQPLEGAVLAAFRRRCVWLDPEVRLLNGSLLDNLRFGNEEAALDQLGSAIRDSELMDLVDHRSGGLTARVGEGGGRLSGGEGQRLRVARGLLRDAQLVLLDEAFRGLDRLQRERLFQTCKQRWPQATTLNVTHDIFEANRHFTRIIVVRGGRIVQDGSPADLLAQRTGHYAQLFRFEETRQTALWSSPDWTQLEMVDGQLKESGNDRHRQPNLV